MKNILFYFILFLQGSFLFSQQQDPLIDTTSPLQQTAWVDSVYNAMTVEERIGQLFMVDLFSSDPEAKAKKIEQLIKDYHLGGIIFSKGGPQRQAKLTNRFQDLSKTPLLIAMDAEWGLAMRLDSTFAYPWNMTLGAVEDLTLIERVGQRIGEHCKRLGVHINFAPVLDINTNPNNPIIGNRSFGEDKENVSQKAIAFMKGMYNAGVLANGKHFPGHGDTETDSHKTLPSIGFSKQRLDSVEFYPYRSLFSKGLESVMVAHLNVPSLEPRQNIPSSLSYKIVTELLQEELGFNGLVFTDALNMKGVSNYKQPGEVDLAAFMAGNDILLISEDVPKAHQLILEAYQNELISEERLALSVKKILKAKYKVGLHKYQPIDTTYLTNELHTVVDDVLYEEVMANAITITKNTEGLLPIRHLNKEKIAYVNFGDDSGEPFLNQLQQYTRVDWIKENTLDGLITKLEDYTTVIIGFHKSNANPWKGYKMTEKELVWIYEIARTNRVVLNVFTRPYALLDLKTSANFESIVVSYQNSQVAQEVSAQIIFGARGAKGILPVSAGVDFPVNSSFRTQPLKRLQYGVPESVGLNSAKLKKVDSLAKTVVSEQMAPGLQLLIAKDGKVVFQKSYGFHTPQQKQQVTNSDVYDLASLTKILASVPLLMQLTDEGEISLESTLGELLPEYKNSNKTNISLKRMLSHYAGLESWIPFYKNTIDPTSKYPLAQYYKKTPDSLYSKVVTEKLYARNDLEDSIHQIIRESDVARRIRYKYSDLPFYILKKYFEDHYGRPLEQLVQDFFYKPIGANRTGYLPTLHFSLDEIVPTEMDIDFRQQKVHGFVHDQGAAMMGGVGGHAGLFANANDVAKLMQMYLWNGMYGGRQYISQETIDAFNACYYCEEDVRRGVGFDKPQLDDIGPTCGCVSMTSFGHSGFTGTYTWADPETGIVYVFLSNRTYPDVNNRKLIRSDVRTKIQEAIQDAIDF